MRVVQLVKKKFTSHPHAAGESYCKHLTYALRASFKLAKCAAAAATHALFPFVFETYVSDRVPALAREMTARRRHVETGKRKGVAVN